jgi:hypothetical protein
VCTHDYVEKICNSTKRTEQVENKNNTGSKAIESMHFMVLQMYSVLIDLYTEIFCTAGNRKLYICFHYNNIEIFQIKHSSQSRR